MKGEKNKLYDSKHTVREKGKEGDYYWYIYMYRDSPCAYVGVGPDHPAFDLDYHDLFEIEMYGDCHGGFTYSAHNNKNSMSCIKAEIKWFGWDYGHSGDHYGTWTIKDIKEDIKAVIKGFRELAKNSGAKTKCADCFGYEVTEGHWACAFPLCVKEYDYDPITRSWLPKLNVPEEYQPYPNISCDRRDEKYEKPDNREPKEAETLTEYMIRVDDVGVRKSEERKAGIPEVEYQFSNYEPKEERTCETCKYRTVHGNEEICSNCNINWRLKNNYKSREEEKNK